MLSQVIENNDNGWWERGEPARYLLAFKYIPTYLRTYHHG